MRIAIASDHAAVALKRSFATWLNEAGHAVPDLATDDDDRVDHPRYGLAPAAGLADANAIATGGPLAGEGMTEACVNAFLTGDFPGRRHQHRVDMLSHPHHQTGTMPGEFA